MHGTYGIHCFFEVSLNMDALTPLDPKPDFPEFSIGSWKSTAILKVVIGRFVVGRRVLGEEDEEHHPRLRGYDTAYMC